MRPLALRGARVADLQLLPTTEFIDTSDTIISFGYSIRLAPMRSAWTIHLPGAFYISRLSH
jgi:hypothetical protein